METVTHNDILDYWKEQLENSRRAVEVAEEMVCFYGMQIALRREIDSKMASEAGEHNHHHSRD